MRQSKTAIKELTAAYRAVLRHAFCVAMGLGLATGGAMAATVAVVDDSNTITGSADVYTKAELATTIAKADAAATGVTAISTALSNAVDYDTSDPHNKNVTVTMGDKSLVVSGNGSGIVTIQAYEDGAPVAGGKTSVYTEAGINSTLENYAKSADVYTKDEIDTTLADYAKSDDVYTQTQIDAKVSDLSDDISANADDIATNATDIATNKTNIATNATDIATNKTNIATNATDIATNKTNIATNTADIATNAAAISANATDIATNASDIAQNKTDIAKNAADIATNATDIATNKTNIANNASNIALHGAAISTNSAAITTNASNISAETIARQKADSALDGKIATNTSAIATINASDAMTSGINSTKVAQIETNKNAIATETENRIAAIDQLESDYQAADNALNAKIADNTAAINTEISDRTLADTELQNNIDAEAQARDAQDVILQANIDNEIKNRNDADKALHGYIIDEAVSRTIADTNITNGTTEFAGLNLGGTVVNSVSSDVDINGGNTNVLATTAAVVDALDDMRGADNNFAGTNTFGAKTTISSNGTITTAQRANLNGGIAVNTNKFTVDAANGDTKIAGTLTAGDVNVQKITATDVMVSSLDAGNGAIRTTGTVSAGTMKVAGNANIGGDIAVSGTTVLDNKNGMQFGANGQNVKSIEKGAITNGVGSDTALATTSAVAGVVGNMDAVAANEHGNLSNGTGTAPTTVADALQNIDASMGKIHGLANADGTVNNEKSTTGRGTNLARGTTVEEHLVSVDNAIGNRNIKSANADLNKASAESVANGLWSLGNTVGSMDLSSTQYLADKHDITSAFHEVDYQLGRMDDKMETMREDMASGFAGAAAMSALVPNARAHGNTQLSIGTGVYQSKVGIAAGMFHYVNDNILLNAGAAYGGSNGFSGRAGITFSW